MLETRTYFTCTSSLFLDPFTVGAHFRSTRLLLEFIIAFHEVALFLPLRGFGVPTLRSSSR